MFRQAQPQTICWVATKGLYHACKCLHTFQGWKWKTKMIKVETCEAQRLMSGERVNASLKEMKAFKRNGQRNC